MRVFKLCLIFLFLIISLYFSLFFIYGEQIREAGSARRRSPNTNAPSKIHLNDQTIAQELKLYRNFVEASHSSSPRYFNESKWAECKEDKDFFAMYTDIECVYLWIRRMKTEEIAGIDNISSVCKTELNPFPNDKPMSNGGFRILFSDTMGYWKPCTLVTGNMESYLSEIISYHIDRLLGFLHTPPVIPYFISTEVLRSLAQDNYDEYAVQKIETIIESCSTDGGVEGALVGWSIYPLRYVNTKDSRFGFINLQDLQTREEVEEIKREKFTLTNESRTEQIVSITETMSAYLFSVVVGNMKKFDHNLFQIYDYFRSGQFIYIDNDRSQWEQKASRNSFLRGLNPLSKICKFPQHIADRILKFRNDNTNDIALGDYIFELAEEVLLPMMKADALFSKHNVEVLNYNVDYLASMIDHCAHRNGVDSIFVEEHWSRPTIEDYQNLINYSEL